MSEDDWHPADIQDLVKCIKAGAKIEDLAPYLARGEVEIRDKARELGFEAQNGVWMKKPPAPSIRRDIEQRRRA